MTTTFHVRRVIAAAAVFLLVAGPARSVAQTRAEEIEKKQEEKARTAHPYQPTGAEKFFTQLEEGKWFLATPRGWYPMFGSIYPGGGITAGGGYREYIGYDSFVEANGLYSIKGYKLVQASAFTPNHLGERVDFAGRVGWLDATQIPYFGLGIDSDPDGRSNFRLNRTYVEGAARLRPVRWLALTLDGGYDDYNQKSGLGNAPSIEEVYTPATAPLLGEDSRYLRGQASATAFWLENPAYARRGGAYRIAYEEFNPLGADAGGTFGFARMELIQHIPVFRETWVLSLRARTESIVRKSDVVPYYLMPSLGSGSTLRGYTTNRFRDRHALLLSGEWRWFPNRQALDMALFFDAGHVAPQRSQLSLGKMKTDAGIGIRFHTPLATALRVDLARGSEGWRVVFAASAPF